MVTYEIRVDVGKKIEKKKLIRMGWDGHRAAANSAN